MRLSDSLILAIDTETTGPKVEFDRIIELGGAYVFRGQPWGPLQRTPVNPGQYISAGAITVHGIRAEDVANAPKWPEVAGRLKAHLDEVKPVLCGYNAIFFDAAIIHAENDRHGIEWRLPPILDPFLWARWDHRGERTLKLGTVCELYGIKLPEDRAHSADADSYATGLLLMGMLAAGILPDDVDEAFARQAQIQRDLDAEMERFGRYLYEDRKDGTLRLGLGKHVGTRLVDAEHEYLRWMLGRPDLPDEAREHVRRTLGKVEQMGFGL
ncbi:MAG: exonuclease domain-containing protein [Bradymonadia bacterium]